MAKKPELDPVRGAMQDAMKLTNTYSMQENPREELARKRTNQAAADARTRGPSYAEQQRVMAQRAADDRARTMARSGRK